MLHFYYVNFINFLAYGKIIVNLYLPKLWTSEECYSVVS